MTGTDKTIGETDLAASVEADDLILIEPAGGGDAQHVTVETLLDGVADVATAGDQANAAAISAEAAARLAADLALVDNAAGDRNTLGKLSTALGDEAAARSAAIDAEASTGAVADSAETAARQAADAAIVGAITALVGDATSGRDTLGELSAAIDALGEGGGDYSALIDGAPADRDTLNELSIAIDEETSARETAVAAEASTRADADSDEVAARQAADAAMADDLGDLSTAIDSEAAARQAADTALIGTAGAGRDTLGELSDALDAEAAARAAAVTGEATNRDTAITAAVTALKDGVGGDANTLKKLRDLQLVDAAAIGAEAVARAEAVGDEITARQAAVAGEASARAGGDAAQASALVSAVNSIKDAAPAGRDTLKKLSNAVDTEAVQRAAAVAGEAARVDSRLAGLTQEFTDLIPPAINQVKAELRGGATPDRDTLRKLGSLIDGAVLGASGGSIVYATKAALDADLAHGDNTKAEVWADPVEASNGVYLKAGASGTGAWSKIGDLAITEIADRLAALEALGITNLATTNFAQVSGDALPTDIDLVGAITDDGADGNLRLFLEMFADGSVGASTLRVLNRLLLSGPILAEGVSLEPGFFNYDFAICDGSDNVIVGLLDDEWLAPGTTVDDGAPLAAADAQNRAYAEEVRNRLVTTIAAFDHDYNLYVELGQSNRETAESWPSLSAANVDGALRYGKDIHSAAYETFTPTGQAFQALSAHVVDDNCDPLSDAAVAALTPGAVNRGESPGYGAVNLFKILSNQRRGVMADAARTIVLNNCARGGRSLDELRKSHTLGPTEWYGRYPSLLSQTTTLAATAGKTHQVLGFGFMQGESEYLGTGLSHTRADYKALLKTYLADVQADAIASGGNSRPPGFFLWQVGGDFTRDVDIDGAPDLFVGMATWEFVRETPGAWLVGPYYAYTDKGGHMDSNGVRWAGLKEALVLDRVITQRRDWEPLAPLAVALSGQTLDIHYHVPAPPLRWGTSYRDGVAYDFTDKGFYVEDALGTVPIAAATIAAPSVVRLSLGRVTSGQAYVWYADYQKTTPNHKGMGNLRDSDSVDPLFAYTYLAGSGMYASANIAALAGKPYDMSNWAIAHMLPAPWTRS